MKSIFLFLLSGLICILALSLERLAGIEWDFHPDANTYISNSRLIAEAILQQGPLLALNNTYYLIVNLFGSDLIAVTMVNIAIYSITNVILGSYFSQFLRLNQPKGLLPFLLFALVLFNPYRIHLAVHVLKDSFIILSLLLVAVSWRLSVLSWLPVLLFRLGGLIYIFSFITRRNILLLMAPICVYVALHPEIVSFILDSKQVDMRFRSFDKVPNFYQYGLLGAGLRAIIWPFFVLTGAFFLTSPTVMFLPIAVGSIFLQIWCWVTFRRLSFLAIIYAPMGIIAIITPGFTSYIRYVLPILTIVPIFMMQGKYSPTFNLYQNFMAKRGL